MAELIKIFPENPNPRAMAKVIEVLHKGGVIIYPTDTVYGIGCDLTKPKAIERVAQIKGEKAAKANLSLICYDLSTLTNYSKPVGNDIFKLMKATLPGPFTFILNANNNVPKIFKGNKKTVGIRVPNNNIARELVLLLGNPIVSTSVHDEDEIIEYTTDPELIQEKYNHLVDLVIDGGIGKNEASTVIDCTTDDIALLRKGLGDVAQFIKD